MRWLVARAVCYKADMLTERKACKALCMLRVALGGPIIFNLSGVVHFPLTSCWPVFVAPHIGASLGQSDALVFPRRLERAIVLFLACMTLGAGRKSLHWLRGIFWAVRESLEGACGNFAAEPRHYETPRVHPRYSQENV